MAEIQCPFCSCKKLKYLEGVLNTLNGAHLMACEECHEHFWVKSIPASAYSYFDAKGGFIGYLE